MADEVTIRAVLNIRSDNVDYRPPMASFRDDVTVPVKGHTPGLVVVTTAGVDVDLSKLSTPGWMWVENTSEDYYFHLGVHDGSVFHPMLEFKPGQKLPVLLSRDLGEEHVISGTGTSATVNTLHAKSVGGSVNAIFDAFEK